MYMLPDAAPPYNKDYRRDTWSHGTNCTVSLDWTPHSGHGYWVPTGAYSGGPQNPTLAANF